MKHAFQFFRIFLWILLAISGIIVFQDKTISLSMARQIYIQVDQVPAYKTALVLGSGNTTDLASPNFSFESRMEKTLELWQKGQLKKIIVSGASNKLLYNEPNDMKNELIKKGISASVIYPDHGGLRTFLSVKRTQIIDPAVPLVIISQRKQLERALYIARCLKIDAVGLEASPIPVKPVHEDIIAEMFSRVKCRLECLFYRTE